MANEQGRAQIVYRGLWLRIVVSKCNANGGADLSPLKESADEGESPVCQSAALRTRLALAESRSSGLERKVGGKFHLKLNTCLRPIAHKYHEGKMKRTLKRELKVPEIAAREADGTSPHGEIVGRRRRELHFQRKCECEFWSSLARWFLPWGSLVIGGRGYLQRHGSPSPGG